MSTRHVRTAKSLTQNGGKPMKELSGKIAVVTGGGSGMGCELVRSTTMNPIGASWAAPAAQG